ncbi:unnamed protein product [Urochloa humidicola]
MCALAPAAARPSSVTVPRRAAPPRFDIAAAGSRALETKKPRGLAVAPPAHGVTTMAAPRHSSASRAGTTRKQIDPARDHLHKRVASELEVLREILKKAELISCRPACKGGAAPAAGKSKRALPAAEPPRAEAGGKTVSAKRRKVSPVPEQNLKQRKAPPWRMSPDERKQLASRLASLAEVPSQIAEFLQKRLGLGGGDADEIEIDFDSAEDDVLFELQALLDKLAAEEPPSPRASEVAQSAEPKKKVQDAPRAAPKEVSISGAIYKAKTQRQLLEMERAVVPDESIQERDLRRLRIAEYGRPGIMRQLGLCLKADA